MYQTYLTLYPSHCLHYLFHLTNHYHPDSNNILFISLPSHAISSPTSRYNRLLYPYFLYNLRLCSLNKNPTEFYYYLIHTTRFFSDQSDSHTELVHVEPTFYPTCIHTRTLQQSGPPNILSTCIHPSVTKIKTICVPLIPKHIEERKKRLPPLLPCN